MRKLVFTAWSDRGPRSSANSRQSCSPPPPIRGHRPALLVDSCSAHESSMGPRIDGIGNSALHLPPTLRRTWDRPACVAAARKV